AQEDFDKLKKLIVFFSKFSIFLYLLVAVPLFTFSDQILQLWLGRVPEHAVLFTRLTLVVILFEVLSAPLWLTVQASGNIRRYQMVISCILTLNLPIAYMSFMVWKQPMLAFIAKTLTAILAYIYRVHNVHSLKCLNLLEYFKQLILRICLLLIVMTPIVWVYMSYNSLSII
ncbi:hypothetical protein ACIKQA_18680, partial [Acinetobacter baumannii]